MASRPISPAEPAKKRPLPIQLNAHPYAIKTTSSALLSRSSSSPHNHMKHHYIPPPPSRVTSGRTRHRHSSSVPTVGSEVPNEVPAIPAPLPAPSPTVVASPDSQSESWKHVDEPEVTHRVRRAETVPSRPIEPVAEHHSDHQKCEYDHDQDSRPVLHAELPPNPKQWSTDQLVAYLEATLSPSNNSTDTHNDILVGIIEYVRTRGLTGRELLRLTDGDLAGTSLSETQRAQLLEFSRTLRTDVLRGRIYVDSYHSQDISEGSKDIHSLSARVASIRGASASTDDLRLLVDNNTREEFAFLPSPSVTLQRSNSIWEGSAQRYRDLARMRMRRRGKVKGLVETWERGSLSGSECSASEEESVNGSDGDPETESVLDASDSPGRSSDLPSDLQDASLDDVCSPSMEDSQEPPSLTPPPPYTHVCAPRDVTEEVEPTIEELLALSSGTPLLGARAWEADFGLGETVKRVPVSLSADTESPHISSIEPSTAHGLKDDGRQIQGEHVLSKRSSVRGSTGRREKNAKTQKRVVTAIFTGDEAHLANDHRRTNSGKGSVREKALARSDLQTGYDNAMRALEESIATTRAQLDVFRARLEQVEADTARQEAELKQVQCSDYPHTFGIRQRQLEVGVQTTVEAEEPPRDEAPARNKDVPDIWEAMSLSDITRAIVARAIGWSVPDKHLSTHVYDDDGQSLVPTDSHLGVDDKCPTPVKKGGYSMLARMSCGIILVSFAICAAVLRRMGFGRWVRRP